MMDCALLIQEVYFSESPSKVNNSLTQSGTAEDSFNSYSVRGRVNGSGMSATGLRCSKSVSKVHTLFPIFLTSSFMPTIWVVRAAMVELRRFSTSFISSIFNINTFKCLFYWDFKFLFLFWVGVGKKTTVFLKFFFFCFGNKRNICKNASLTLIIFLLCFVCVLIVLRFR